MTMLYFHLIVDDHNMLYFHLIVDDHNVLYFYLTVDDHMLYFHLIVDDHMLYFHLIVDDHNVLYFYLTVDDHMLYFHLIVDDHMLYFHLIVDDHNVLYFQLIVDDQILLLKSCCMEIMCLRAACRFDSTNQALFLPSGLTIHKAALYQGSLGVLVEPIFEFATGLAKLELDETEIALLAAVLLMQSGMLKFKYGNL